MVNSSSETALLTSFTNPSSLFLQKRRTKGAQFQFGTFCALDDNISREDKSDLVSYHSLEVSYT